MARGGGGGGRGGGGSRGGARGRGYGSSKSWEQMTPIERGLTVLFMGFVLVMTLFQGGGDSGSGVPEEKLSAFASAQYEQHFADAASYEDNLLLAFIVYEDCERFSYMTWVGDHIGDDAFQYLLGEGTWLDDMLERQLQSDYRHSISEDLSRAIRELAEKLRSVEPAGPLRCGEDCSDSPTKLLNRSGLSLNEILLEDAIADFREITGIPIVLVVEDATDLFQ